MSVLYIDCSSGVCGQMILGALLELCQNPDYLQTELAKLPVDDYQIDISKIDKCGIVGTYVDVDCDKKYHLADMCKMIDQSDIHPRAKVLSKRILNRLAQAECKVHQTSAAYMNLMQRDMILIVGTAILVTCLDPNQIGSSIVNDGCGWIQNNQEMLLVPTPVVSEIFASSSIISQQTDIHAVLVTAVGAAIMAELTESYGPMPAMNIQKTGWGYGGHHSKNPYVLRAFMGTLSEDSEDVIVIETNIDDCSGEILGFTMEKLMAMGARDVFFTPIFMKKNRPAYRLSVVCMEKDLKLMQDLIFKHTTTIGLRYRHEKRAVLTRKIIEVDTPYGKVRAKQTVHDGHIYTYPEYEDAKKIALEYDLPIKEVMRVIQKYIA